MEDLKPKLYILGGVILVFIVGFISYNLLVKSPAQYVHNKPLPDLPVKEMVAWYKDNSTYKDATIQYENIKRAIQKDSTVKYEDVWMNRLQEAYADKLIGEINRFCGKDTFSSAYYRPLRDATEDLDNEMKGKIEVAGKAKVLHNSLLTLYLFHRANKLPKDINVAVSKDMYSTESDKSFKRDISKVEAIPLLVQNPQVRKNMRDCENMLRTWSKEHSGFERISNTPDDVEKLRYDCSTLSNSYYYAQCVDLQEFAFKRFTNGLEEDEVNENFQKWASDLKCTDLKTMNNPFYKRCMQIKLNYKKKFD